MHLLIHYFYVSVFFNTWAATVSSALMIQIVPGQRNVISTRGPVNVLLQEFVHTDKYGTATNANACFTSIVQGYYLDYSICDCKRFDWPTIAIPLKVKATDNPGLSSKHQNVGTSTGTQCNSRTHLLLFIQNVKKIKCKFKCKYYV